MYGAWGLGLALLSKFPETLRTFMSPEDTQESQYHVDCRGTLRIPKGFRV